MLKKGVYSFVRFYLSVSLLLLIISCGDDDQKIAIIPETDVFKSIQSQKVSISEFDNELYSWIQNNTAEEILDSITINYPVLGNDYLTKILGLSSPYYSPEKNRFQQLSFFKDTSVFKLFEVIKEENKLTESLKPLDKYIAYYQHHFPETKTPTIITMNSGFSYQIINYGDTLLLGKDLFMGKDFNYPPTIPNFLRHTYAPAYAIPKILRALLETKTPETDSYRFIDLIINNGKKMYALEQLLPGYSEHMVTNWTEEKYLWVSTFEKEIWQTFQKDQLLFSTDYEKFKKHLEPSPNAPGMPKDAPGEIGNYIGWQIVKKYMENHPEKTLQDILNMTDGNIILQQSKYKP